jgi:hypothetical protein
MVAGIHDGHDAGLCRPRDFGMPFAARHRKGPVARAGKKRGGQA